MRVKYHLWHVVLIRLNCGAEKNIQSPMTFVLCDKSAGVILTLQLVNLSRLWCSEKEEKPYLEPYKVQHLLRAIFPCLGGQNDENDFVVVEKKA